MNELQNYNELCWIIMNCRIINDLWDEMWVDLQFFQGIDRHAPTSHDFPQLWPKLQIQSFGGGRHSQGLALMAPDFCEFFFIFCHLRDAEIHFLMSGKSATFFFLADRTWFCLAQCAPADGQLGPRPKVGASRAGVSIMLKYTVHRLSTCLI